MLDQLKRCNSLEEAAEQSAGNWQNWKNFVWFGSDMPNSDQVMLGYLLGPNSDSVDESNALTVKKAMDSFMGMIEDPSKNADNFGSSFWGDKNALSGLMVRVRDNEGNITKAFETLYNVSQNYTDDGPIDDNDFKVANKRSLLRWIYSEIDSLAKENDVIVEDDTARLSMADQLANYFANGAEQRCELVDLEDLETEFKGQFCNAG